VTITPFGAVTVHGESHPIGFGLTMALGEADDPVDGLGVQPAATNAQPVRMRPEGRRIRELGIAEY